MDENLTDEEYLRKYRGTIQVAVAPCAAANAGPTLMRWATDEELLGRRGRIFSSMMTDKSVMSNSERKLRTLLAINIAGARLYADDGELSDSSQSPSIDFLREDPEVIAEKLRMRGQNSLKRQYDGTEAIIDYTDHLGVRKIRRIRPYHMMFGGTAWDDTQQWLLCAVDLEDPDHTTTIKPYPVKNIHVYSGVLDWVIDGGERMKMTPPFALGNQ
jgi:hypothetical protein